MSTITTSDVRKRLFPLLGQVNDNDSAVTIISIAGNGLVISEADEEARQTTWHLHEGERKGAE